MTTEIRSTITDLLQACSEDDPESQERLWALVYDELRKIAQRCFCSERRDHTLQATALVNEAFLRLVDQRRTSWRDRNHFFAVASGMMRRILVDHARARNRGKRGGGAARVDVDAIAAPTADPSSEIVAVDEALTSLERIDPFKASLVELRFFGGLTHAETAKVLGCSEATVRRHWPVAKAWLRRELKESAIGR